MLPCWDLPSPGGMDTTLTQRGQDGNTPAMRWAGPAAALPGKWGKSSRGCRDGGSSLRWSGLEALGFGTKQSESSYLADVPPKKGSILVCSHCCIVCG